MTWFPELAGGVRAELEDMRRAMAERSQAAVFSGGRTKSFLGTKPGIQQEYEIFRDVHANKPGSVYLVGILGGATLDLIKKIEADAPEPNSLGPNALIAVRQSDNPDLVCGLIIADLMKLGAPPSKEVQSAPQHVHRVRAAARWRCLGLSQAEGQGLPPLHPRDSARNQRNIWLAFRHAFYS